MPTLLRLAASRHPVVAAVSQPDRERGRGRRSSPSPVAEAALRRGIPLLRPERVGDCEEAIRELAPDLGVVVAFGQFVPKRIRELPSLGYCINGHASLLPRWRGAAPIARALLAGDAETGISVMRLEREMDAGPVALTRALPIRPGEDAGSLAARLAELCAECVAEVVDGIAHDRVHWRDQDHAAATLAPKLERDEARIDWSEPADAVVRRVRALAPTPGAWTTLDGDRLRILAAEVAPAAGDQHAADPPGTVRHQLPSGIRVAAGVGWVVPRIVQRSGGRAVAIDAFLRGRPLPDGERLGELG